MGTGVATNLNVAADIAAGVYATNSPGVYNDTVTLTINKDLQSFDEYATGGEPEPQLMLYAEPSRLDAEILQSL